MAVVLSFDAEGGVRGDGGRRGGGTLRGHFCLLGHTSTSVRLDYGRGGDSFVWLQSLPRTRDRFSCEVPSTSLTFSNEPLRQETPPRSLFTTTPSRSDSRFGTPTRDVPFRTSLTSSPRGPRVRLSTTEVGSQFMGHPPPDHPRSAND